MGFVRDNSSKNIEISQDQDKAQYFKIFDNGLPLASTRGLYVITCTNSQAYYYAVTVTNLATNYEDKTISVGQNSLSKPVMELVQKPTPVFQDSVISNGNEVKYRYVQFVNNQETPLYPAMTSVGSFGFNFYITKRGNTSSYPLVVVYEGEGDIKTGNIGLDQSITNCYILGLGDWLPLPNGTANVGDNAHFCCYHENFNIYSDKNSIPNSGIVKTYPQRRYIEAIHWAKVQFPIDSNRIYTKGISTTGLGAMLTAAIIPEEIAAVYAVVEPISLSTHNESVLEQMWGKTASKLNTDIINPKTGDPLSFTKLTDMRIMVGVNEQLDLPLIFDVHGKNDKSVPWSSGKIKWYDSLQINHAGGVFYWDQRSHNGNGKNFLFEETIPDFFRYATNKSYPAFSNCSINPNPGNGTPSNGAPYGAINGYLDWEDAITDEDCNYSINVFVKNLYVNGVLAPDQYSTCKTDVSFRRLQNFQPSEGSTITWKNFNSSNSVIQSGSFVYKGGLITIKSLTVNKSGNRIELLISNCQRNSDVMAVSNELVYFTASSNGYTVYADLTEDSEVLVNMFDLLGRTVYHRKVMMTKGMNTFEIASVSNGMYLVELKGASFSSVNKLLF
jgi:hypothetical protein